MGTQLEMITQIRRELANAQRVLVVSHVRPDGDAVGSLLGLGLPLREASKEVTLVLCDGVPQSLSFLPGSETIVTQAQGPFDLVISLDVSEPTRFGSALDGVGSPDINIDHHITNTMFGRINLVDPHTPATAQIIADHLVDFGLGFSPAAAQALLTGILTDTLGYRVRSVTPQTLRTSALLMEHGANLADVYRQALLQRSLQAARYWGAGLSTLAQEGKIVWSVLSLAARAAAEYPGNDDADLINVLSGIKDYPVAILFVEQADHHSPGGPSIKVSWRAQDDTDVSRVAALFGGGGHRAAAGAEVKGSIEVVSQQVLEATAAAMVGTLSLPVNH